MSRSENIYILLFLIVDPEARDSNAAESLMTSEDKR